MSNGRLAQLAERVVYTDEAASSNLAPSTKDDLAKKADIKYTTLTKVESGVVNKPSVQTMAKIAKALGVSIEELIK